MMACYWLICDSIMLNFSCLLLFKYIDDELYMNDPCKSIFEDLNKNSLSSSMCLQ